MHLSTGVTKLVNLGNNINKYSTDIWCINKIICIYIYICEKKICYASALYDLSMVCTGSNQFNMALWSLLGDPETAEN